jgi:hypothetical protein
MKKLTLFVFSVTFIFPLFLSGCSGQKGPKVYFVTGKVTWNGTPLADASVFFNPIEGSDGEGASGKTDGEGIYKIQTVTGKVDGGTVPGKYKVTFRKTEDKWDGKSYLPNPGGEPIKNSRAVQILPAKYQSDRTTPFEVEVTTDEKKNVFDFSLEGKL